MCLITVYTNESLKTQKFRQQRNNSEFFVKLKTYLRRHEEHTEMLDYIGFGVEIYIKTLRKGAVDSSGSSHS